MLSRTFDNQVYALNARTGAKLWSYATGGQVYSSPAVANGVVYVGSDDRNVYAKRQPRRPLWSYTTGNNASSSPPTARAGPNNPSPARWQNRAGDDIQDSHTSW
jgi:outer membrane protein assembly factor BamB